MPRTPIAALANGSVETLTTLPQATTAVVAPLSNIPVSVVAHGTSTPITVYEDESTGAVLTQPVLTSYQGAIPGWLDVAGLSATGADLLLALPGGVETVVLAAPGVIGGSGGGSVTKQEIDALNLGPSDVGADAAGAATAALETAETAVASEATRAEAAEGTNATAISTETTRAEAAESTKAAATALTAETTRAEGVEATNATAISAETSRAEGSEGANATAISGEISRAEGVEAGKASTTALTTETTRAETAEGTNATAISTETTRAEAAEGTKAATSALTAETTRAEGAESTNATAISTNATAISTETTRAEGVEATKASTTALTAEVSRAEAAEAGLFTAVPPANFSGGTATVDPIVPVNVPPWVGSTVYPAGYVVQSVGFLWGLNGTIGTTHTSASTWAADASNWTQLSSSGGSGSAPLIPNDTVITASGPLTAGQLQSVNASGGSRVMALPSTSTSGQQLAVRRDDSTAGIAAPNTLTFTGTTGDAALPSLLWQDEVVLFVADPTTSGKWWTAGSHKPTGMLDPRYAVQPTNLVYPVLGSVSGASTATAVAGSLFCRRVIVPKTGTLHDVTVVCTANAGGSYILGVYDTGNTTPGSRTLLASSNGNALTTGLAVGNLTFDPALAVTAGQHLDLAIGCTITAPTLTADAMVSRASQLANSSFLPCAGGALPKLAWVQASAVTTALPTAVLEANCANTGNAFSLYARVS